MTGYQSIQGDTSHSLEADIEKDRTIAATHVNLDAADETLKQNSQQAYNEQYASYRVNGDGMMMTMAAILKHDEEVKEKLSEITEQSLAWLAYLDMREEWSERRFDLMLKISKRDAETLASFVDNDDVKEELHNDMCKGGLKREYAKKALQAYGEYTKLSKRQHEGSLDVSDKEKLEELEHSKLVKFAQKYVVRLARKKGMTVDASEPDVELPVSQTSSYNLWLDQAKSVTGKHKIGESADPKSLGQGLKAEAFPEKDLKDMFSSKAMNYSLIAPPANLQQFQNNYTGPERRAEKRTEAAPALAHS